jgi:hypothetical protein
MHHHHGRDNRRKNQGGQRPEDNATPFNANPKSVFTVAATMRLASQNQLRESLPESPPTSYNVVRLTVRALHPQIPSNKEPVKQFNSIV